MLVVNTAKAEDVRLSGKEILQRMVKAMETSDYQGTIVFHKNDNLEAMKYFHSLEDGKRSHERLVSLNSPQREIVRKDSEVTCLFKATKQLIVDHRPYQHSFIVDMPNNIDELQKSYDFEVVGEEDVAMMPAYIVKIQPKDKLRFLRKVWVTKAHFLPIKAVIYDLSSNILEQIVFTELQVNKTDAKSLNLQDAIKPDVEAAQEVINTDFSARVLPPGFKQIFFTRNPIHQSGQPVDHLVLSDGLASVSIYAESKKPDISPDLHALEGTHSVGAINSISRNISSSQITVLGEVPADTVKMIAEGIELNP